MFLAMTLAEYLAYAPSANSTVYNQVSKIGFELEVPTAFPKLSIFLLLTRALVTSSVGTLPNGYVRSSPLPRITNTRVPRGQITSPPSTCKPIGHTKRTSIQTNRPLAVWPHNHSIAIRANYAIGNRSNRLIIV
jgi:hypothetical protein